MSDALRAPPRDWLALDAPERTRLGEVIISRGANDDDGAAFDATRAYRYAYWRTWRPAGPKLFVITLHPQSADEKTTDQITRLAREWARRLGYGSVWIGNLFARRVPTFRALTQSEDPIGPANDWWLARMHAVSDATLVAWGDHGRHLDRGRVVMSQLLPVRSVQAIGVTGSGQPHHLHGLPASATLRPFEGIPPERVWCRKCQAHVGTAEGTLQAKIVQIEHDRAHHVPRPFAFHRPRRRSAILSAARPKRSRS